MYPFDLRLSYRRLPASTSIFHPSVDHLPTDKRFRPWILWIIEEALDIRNLNDPSLQEQGNPISQAFGLEDVVCDQYQGCGSLLV
jgi:hypothetical protein